METLYHNKNCANCEKDLSPDNRRHCSFCDYDEKCAECGFCSYCGTTKEQANED